ncbi:MAG: hypothetical protein KIT27_01140 [Legionellales bacterium]|nr:hypothetical protein [Legionellales bacterium]
MELSRAPLLFLITALIVFMSQTFAAPRWSIEGKLTSEGKEFGISYYGDVIETGVSGSVDLQDDNYDDNSHVYEPTVFFGIHKPIGKEFELTAGLDYGQEIGKRLNERIVRAYAIGPYIGVNYFLSKQFGITSWVNPYRYSYEKLRDVAGLITLTKRQLFFKAGGISIVYFFA